MKSATALELTRGMNIKLPVHFLAFLDRKLDHDGYHYDTVDGVIINDDGEVVVFGFNKVVILPASQYVYLLD